jgi:hypothetical protein
MILYKNLVPILAVQFSYTTQQQGIKANHYEHHSGC